LISARTKAVLAAKKAQGVKLGNPHFAETIGRAHAASRAIADQFAANVLTPGNSKIGNFDPAGHCRRA